LFVPAQDYTTVTHYLRLPHMIPLVGYRCAHPTVAVTVGPWFAYTHIRLRLRLRGYTPRYTRFTRLPTFGFGLVCWFPATRTTRLYAVYAPRTRFTLRWFTFTFCPHTFCTRRVILVYFLVVTFYGYTRTQHTRSPHTRLHTFTTFWVLRCRTVHTVWLDYVIRLFTALVTVAGSHVYTRLVTGCTRIYTVQPHFPFGFGWLLRLRSHLPRLRLATHHRVGLHVYLRSLRWPLPALAPVTHWPWFTARLLPLPHFSSFICRLFVPTYSRLVLYRFGSALPAGCWLIHVYGLVTHTVVPFWFCTRLRLAVTHATPHTHACG